MTDVDAFAQKIAEILEESTGEIGMSQNALAKKSGVSQAQISRIFSGKRDVSLTQLFSIALALGKSGSALLAEAEARLAASAQAAPEPEVVRIPVMGDVDFEPIPPSEEKMLALAANATAEDLERSRLEEIGEESQLPPEEWDE